MIVKPLHNQSNIDICLQVYGSLDNFIKLCKDNFIENVNVAENREYYFNENSVIYKNVTGFPYCTDINVSYYKYSSPSGELYYHI